MNVSTTSCNRVTLVCFPFRQPEDIFREDERERSTEGTTGDSQHEEQYSGLYGGRQDQVLCLIA